jgi:hypothetical protein
MALVVCSPRVSHVRSGTSNRNQGWRLNGCKSTSHIWRRHILGRPDTSCRALVTKTPFYALLFPVDIEARVIAWIPRTCQYCVVASEHTGKLEAYTLPSITIFLTMECAAAKPNKTGRVARYFMISSILPEIIRSCQKILGDSTWDLDGCCSPFSVLRRPPHICPTFVRWQI